MIVLDTHTWLWWLHDPDRLSEAARAAVQAAVQANDAYLSVISVWEVAVKNQLGKLALPLDLHAWYERARRYPGIIIEPLAPDVAIASTLLPGGFHKDPADRLIVATALRRGCPLVTRDHKILDYPHVQTIG